MKKTQFVLVSLFVFTLFALISAQESNKPKGAGGGKVTDKNTQSPKNEKKPQTRPNKPLPGSSGFGGGRSAWEDSFEKSEERKAFERMYSDPNYGTFDFMKDYPESQYKQGIIDNILDNAVEKIGLTYNVGKDYVVSPDFKYAISKGLTVFDLENNVMLKKLGGVLVNKKCIDFSTDSRKLLAGSYFEKRQPPSDPRFGVRGCSFGNRYAKFGIWDIETGNKLQSVEWKMPTSESNLHSARFSAEESQVIITTDHTVSIWDAKTGKALKSMTDKDFLYSFACFSPDMKYFAACGRVKTEIKSDWDGNVSKGSLRVWNAETGELAYSYIEELKNLDFVRFSADSSMLATQTEKNNIKIREVSTGKYLANIYGHTNEITDCVFSPDGKLLFSTSKDGTSMIWNISEEKKVRTIYEFSRFNGIKFEGNKIYVWMNNTKFCFTLHEKLANLTAPIGRVYAIEYSNNGKMIAAATDRGNIKIWNAETRDVLHEFSGNYAISKLCFTSDDKKLVSNGFDGAFKIWNLENGKLIKRVKAHEGRILTMDVSTDDKFIATGSADNTVKIWKLEDGSLFKTISDHTGQITGLDFSGSGKYFITCSEGEEIKLWDANDFKFIKDFKIYEEPFKIVFSPDSEYFAYISQGDVRLHSFDDGRFKGGISIYRTGIKDFRFSKDSKSIYTLDNEFLNIWNIDPNRRIRTESNKPLNKIDIRKDTTYSFELSPDEKTVITGTNRYQDSSYVSDEYGILRFWHTDTVGYVKQLQPRYVNYQCSDMSSVKNIIALGYENYYAKNGTQKHFIEIWDADKALVIRKFEGHDTIVSAVKFSPDGKILASGSRGKLTKREGKSSYVKSDIKLWDVESGKLLQTIETPTHFIRQIDFSPDGKYVTACGKATVDYDENDKHIATGALRVWDVATGKLVFDLKEPRDPKALGYHLVDMSQVQYSQDGKYIASVSYVSLTADKANVYNYLSDLYLWNAETGELVRKDRYNDKLIGKIKFVNGGKTLLTCERDLIKRDFKPGYNKFRGFIRFRNVETGELEREFSNGDVFYTGSISPDDSTMYTIGYTMSYGDNNNQRYGHHYKLKVWDLKTGLVIQEPRFYADHNTHIDFSNDGHYIVLNGRRVAYTLKHIEDKIGEDVLFKHLFNYKTASAQVSSCFAYSRNGNQDIREKYLDWEAIAKNYPDKNLSEVQELFSMDRMHILFWYFDALPIGLGDEEWLTEKDGEYYATCKFKMRKHSRDNTELDEWYLTVKARLNKRAFTWQIVDMGNFPLDLMGLSKITIKYKDTKAGYWMELDYLVTPKQREALEKKLAENPEYLPQEYYVEFYSRSGAKRLKPIG